MLGAGMVILQPSTHKVVVVYETEGKYWFFPKGRKDIGESLETTAIREAYEEVRMVPDFSGHVLILGASSQDMKRHFYLYT